MLVEGFERLVDLVGQDRRRRQELATSLDTLLADLPPAQQQFGRVVLQAFRSGQLDDDKLFAVFDRMAGSQEPRTMLGLAFLAAGTGPRAEQARKALELLPEESTRVTTAQLSYLAAQGNEEAKAAPSLG